MSRRNSPSVAPRGCCYRHDRYFSCNFISPPKSFAGDNRFVRPPVSLIRRACREMVDRMQNGARMRQSPSGDIVRDCQVGIPNQPPRATTIVADRLLQPTRPRRASADASRPSSARRLPGVSEIATWFVSAEFVPFKARHGRSPPSTLRVETCPWAVRVAMARRPPGGPSSSSSEGGAGVCHFRRKKLRRIAAHRIMRTLVGPSPKELPWCWTAR